MLLALGLLSAVNASNVKDLRLFESARATAGTPLSVLEQKGYAVGTTEGRNELVTPPQKRGRLLLAQARPLERERLLLKNFESLRVSVAGAAQWLQQGNRILISAAALFMPPNTTPPDPKSLYRECLSPSDDRAGSLPSIFDKATYTSINIDKDGTYDTRYWLDAVGEAELKQAIPAVRFIAVVIEVSAARGAGATYFCDVADKAEINIRIPPPLPASSSSSSVRISGTFTFLIDADEATRRRCAVLQGASKQPNLVTLTTQDGLDLPPDQEHPMVGTANIVLSLKTAKADCEIVEAKSNLQELHVLFDRRWQALVLVPGWRDQHLITLVVQQKKSAEKRVSVSIAMLDLGGAVPTKAIDLPKNLKVYVDGTERPWSKDKPHFVIAADRAVSIQMAAAGFVIASVSNQTKPVTLSDEGTFLISPQVPDGSQLTVALRPADRKVVVRLTGRGADDARSLVELGKGHITYMGQDIKEGSSFSARVGTTSLELNLPGLKINRVITIDPKAVSSTNKGANLIYERLSYASTTEITIDLTPLFFKQFKVSLGGPVDEATLLALREQPLLQFGDKLLSASTLKSASLRFDSDANSLQLIAPGFRIMDVKPNPPGFARLERGSARVLLESSKLNSETTGEVRLDLGRFLAPGFKIEPVVAVGGQQVPFLDCDFAIAASEPGGAVQRLRRTQQNNVALLSLEQEIIGGSFALKATGCEGVTVPAIPLPFGSSGRNEPLRIVIPVEAKRFYVAIAPFDHNAIRGQTTIWQNALKNATEFYALKRNAEIVNTGVLALEHFRDDPAAIVVPDNIVFPRSFPPIDNGSIAEKIARRLSGSSTAGIDQVINRLRQPEFQDVTSVYLMTVPIGWSCTGVLDDYRRLVSLRKKPVDMTVIIASLSPVGWPDRERALEKLQNSGGNARAYRCHCQDPNLSIYAFEADSEAESDRWRGAFELIRDSARSQRACMR
jgi:hypothetical protein